MLKQAREMKVVNAYEVLRDVVHAPMHCAIFRSRQIHAFSNNLPVPYGKSMPRF